MANRSFNIPNSLTMLRLLLAPFIMYSILIDQTFLALGLFFVALLTDNLDGRLARKLNAETSFGRVTDVLADKILFGLVLLAVLMKFDQVFWLWIYGILLVGYLLGAVIFVKKKVMVTPFGRIFISFQSILLILMIMGVVNHLLIVIFLILLIIPAAHYLIRLAKR